MLCLLLFNLIDYGILEYCTLNNSLILSRKFNYTSFINNNIRGCNNNLLTIYYILLIMFKVTNSKIINWKKSDHQINSPFKNYKQSEVVRKNKTNNLNNLNLEYNNYIDFKLQNRLLCTLRNTTFNNVLIPNKNKELCISESKTLSIDNSILEINEKEWWNPKKIHSVNNDNNYLLEKGNIYEQKMFDKVQNKPKRKKDSNEYSLTTKKRKHSEKKKRNKKEIVEKANETEVKHKFKFKTLKSQKQIARAVPKFSKTKVKRFKKTYVKNLKKGRPITLSNLIQYEELRPLIIQAEILDYDKCIIFKN